VSGPVDAVQKAFLRCEVLSQIVAQAKARAMANPTDEYTVKLGITSKGEPKSDADKKIRQIFEQLDGLIAHLALLDIVASFELAFGARLKNAVGEARKAVRENYPPNSSGLLFQARESLVRQVDHYGGIGGIEALLKPHLDAALLAKLQNIRENRNQFAHGTDVEILPTIQRADALKALSEIAGLL
jgi:hypothetical protein